MKLNIYFIGIILGILSFFQNDDIVQKLKIEKDLIILNNKIQSLINKEDSIKSKKTNIYHIFYLEYCGEFKKELFLSNKFIDYLRPSYQICKPTSKYKYLRTSSLISDTSGNFIALFDGKRLYPYLNKQDSIYSGLTKLLHYHEIDFMFLIEGLSYTYIGVKNEKIFFFSTEEGKINRHSVFEFVECCWDKYIYLNTIKTGSR